MKLFGRILANILGYAAFLVLAMFAEAAIYICSPLSEETNTVFSLVITLTTLYAFAFRRTWRSRFLCVLPVHLLFFGWYLSMSPKMEANWAREVAVLPDMEIQGDTLSVKNIRYFHYRSETDFDPAYYDKKFDFSRI